MPKTRPQLEVLVLGSHPCAYLAALLLHGASVRVQLSSVPHEHMADRLIHINPQFFELNEITRSLKNELALTEYRGLTFLGNNPASRGPYDQPAAVMFVTTYSSVQNALRARVEKEKIVMHRPVAIDIGTVDEKGVEVFLDGEVARPRLVLAGDPLPEHVRRALGVPLAWDVDILQTYVFLRTNTAKIVASDKRFLMSLELDDAEHWGWAYQHGDELQVAVTASPAASDAQLKRGMQQWIATLNAHHVIDGNTIDVSKLHHMNLPLGGALTQEDVGNRTLLFGPAGGFYSASGEDVYPNCWSAIFAADVAKKALKETHVQDGLQAYRHRWGATLGDYLRGPQQNLKFLLPLVYRNPVMCARLAESILTGASVVR